ncbi:alpha/beta fold hydrolase [uncultured Maribacter sp.]|uniref:alpha/beta fold hydrolase n=1 Tax=uncultured Maribacter sp. TaxID=431308 RepID=UPI002634FC7B|nr:alpha/beta fold hydrolase [uncultured Maribacter sp.]
MRQILHSKIIGEGKPICILHGFLGMSDNWKTLGSQYANEGMQVHLIDQRNHGKSFHADTFNYDILAEDLKNYLEHHGIEQTILIGHSMGGKTVMQFACSYPNMTRKIIVADIAPKFYPPHHQTIIDGLNIVSTEGLTSRKEVDANLAKHIPEIGIRQFLLKNLYWEEKGKLGFRFNLKVLKNKMEEIGENISNSDSYNGPTLFLRGDKSEYVMPNDSPIIKSYFPNAVIETIDNAGHWLHAENPKQFFSKSVLFINQ